MYFPWVGLLEQIRLCDVFVHYDDVQFARGFLNRVQIKTDTGTRWITVPLKSLHRGQLINDTAIDNTKDWRNLHYELLKQSYRRAPFIKDMLYLVESVFSKEYPFLHQLTRQSMISLANYFGLTQNKTFIDATELQITGSGSQRLHDICTKVGATAYITGHGAMNYLNHEIFETSNIAVKYMNYRKMPYPQLHGEFTPYVSALDLVANCGKAGIQVICSEAIYWKEFARATGRKICPRGKK
jgi:hypothetical protein